MYPFLRIPVLLKNYLLGKYSRSSYSQEGEDLIIARLLATVRRGFYVDVGSHHPLRFSNTYLLYKKGWHGINIDATPGSMHLFRFFRPRDTNLEIGISSKKGSKNFYIFADPAINTFDKSVVKRNILAGYSLRDTKTVKTMTLSDVLKQHCITRHIDLLTIDVEGLDYQVLISNDWNIFQPTVVVVEVFDTDIEKAIKSRVSTFLKAKGYSPYAKTANSLIFRKKLVINSITNNEYSKVKRFLKSLPKAKLTWKERLAQILLPFIPETVYVHIKKLISARR